MSDLDHSSEPNIATDKLSQRRRALMKGSAVAIPAILTLRSGSALAAQSAASCLVLGGDAPVAIDTYPSPPAVDDWLRQTTFCQTIHKQNSSDPNIDVFLKPGTPNTWYETSVNSNNPISYSKQNATTFIRSDSIVYDIIGTQRTCYVLVLLNQDGTKSGVYGAPGSSYYLATESCYDSIN
jgi:hypothetical protein